MICNSWVELKLDTQIVGALLQVLAAGLVAWYLQWRSDTDRKVATAIAMDHEWNTPSMIHARHLVHECMNNNLGAPRVSGSYFEEFWIVRMYFMRLAHMRRASLIDEKLFVGLIAKDAGSFAKDVAAAWGDYAVTGDDLAEIQRGQP